MWGGIKKANQRAGEMALGFSALDVPLWVLSSLTTKQLIALL